MKRLLFISFLIISFYGCVTQEQAIKAAYPNMIELACYKFPNELCSDPEYTGCHEISKEQCIKELNQINSQCIEDTKLKIGTPSKENKNAFMWHYSSCLSEGHLSIRKREGLSPCGKEAALKMEEIEN